MEESLDAPVRITAIAERLGITAKTLENLFRNNVEMTPGAYYLRLRLGAARRLLLDTRRSVTEIAVRTGFSSIAALSRAFRKQYARSPRQFRRQL